MEDLIIKNKRGASPIVAVLSLLMLGASIYCMLLPVLNSYDQNLEYFFFGAGITGVAYFGFLAVNQLITAISPGNAVVLTEDGFYDFTLPGGGAGFIDWESITRTKIYGSKKSKFVGIDVQKPKKLFRDVKKKAYDEIMSNIESGMPAVVIDCRRIEMTPEELAEEIGNYKKDYIGRINSLISKNDNSDFDVRRRGSATLEDEDRFNEKPVIPKKHATLTEPGAETRPVPSSEITDSDDEIADILRSLESVTTVEDKDEKTDKKDDKKAEDKKSDVKEEKPLVTEYRDYGLLFPEDDDD
ncbi:MAG: hypothetical protein PHV95_07820 [Eubacteriales bacterium]|nr:hypothetical protein [Eubacteriales bacterium]